jgi:hypothetical protein
MATLNNIQQTIAAKRQIYQSADQAYYASLQEWSLTGNGQPAVLNNQKSRDKAFTDLQTAIGNLQTGSGSQQWITEVSAGLPFLLLPVRVEARYVTVRHMLRNLNPNDILDISNDPDLGPKLQNIGFSKDEDGVMTYLVPSMGVNAAADGTLIKTIGTGTLVPKSGKWIQRMDDDSELRIRIYPDDIFFETLEQSLQSSEWDAGVSFWQAIWTGADPETQWLQITVAYKPARAAWIIKTTRPTNYVSGQPLPASPVFPAQNLKDGPYTEPPRARLLPDCFVLRLYKNGNFTEFTGLSIPEPLVLGLDPTHDPFDSDPASGMTQGGTEIQTPAYLDWIHDFDAALSNGLAFRVNLKQYPQYQTGVDKILIMGVKLSADETESEKLLSDLMQNHLFKEDGMSIVPKGTPTNNFGDQKSGYNDVETESLAYFNSQWQAAPPSSVLTDETRFNTALGLDPAFRIPMGVTTDISEALLMNELLWPATWGYYFLQFFSPAMPETVRETARQFFTQSVVARGLLPVIRVNSQPYGIIPTTSLADWQYASTKLSDAENFSMALWSGYLSKLYTLWQSWVPNIKTVAVGGEGLDSNFFDIVSMTATSQQLQRQWMAGLGFQSLLKAAQANTLANIALLGDPNFQTASFAAALNGTGVAGADYSQLLNAYNTTLHDINRVIIDGLPVSEDRAAELIAGKSWNYLQWLAQAKMMDIWSADYTAIPPGNGATDSSADVSVLAVLARQAVLRAYLETGIKTVETDAGLLLLKIKDFELEHLQTAAISVDPVNLVATNLLQQEYKTVLTAHPVNTAFVLQPDRRLYFNQAYPSTGTQNLSDWLDTQKTTTTLQPLQGSMQALNYFSQLSTAKLQRLLMEHLDLCSHRLDAWISGMIFQRIQIQRASKPTGINIGAYGWLLGLVPGGSPAVVFEVGSPVYLDATNQNANTAAIPLVHAVAAKTNGIDISAATWNRAFFYLGSTVNPGASLDTTTGEIEPTVSLSPNPGDGFIHAPSMSHAAAAAILRSAYLNHESDDETALLALQLNSPRVRQALQLLDGMQNGNSIGELLGYYFERLLHDNQLDQYLYDLRLAFPLPRTGTDPSSPSMFTCVDGQALLGSRRNNLTGWLTTVTGINSADYAKIDAQAAVLEDYLDSLNDLLLAESVYQTAKGNRDRAAAALRIMNGGGQPVTPEFPRTPMNGTTITHRVGIVFQQQGTSPKGWTTAGSPRSLFMPDLNAWLASRLPSPSDIAVTVDLGDGTKDKILLMDLNIEPVDLLYAMPSSFAQTDQSPLATYVQLAANIKYHLDFPLAAGGLEIDFKDRSELVDSEISIFELATLLTAMKNIISSGRPLSPNDFLLPNSPASTGTQISADRLKTVFQNYSAASGPAAQTIQAIRGQVTALNTGLQQNKTAADLKSVTAPLIQNLFTAWQLGVETNSANGIFIVNDTMLPSLAGSATSVANDLENRLTTTTALYNAVTAGSDGQTYFSALQNVSSVLFAGKITLLPDITLSNADDVNTAYNGRAEIKLQGITDIGDWIREAALVRKNLMAYRQSVFLSETLNASQTIADPVILQFPFFTGTDQNWVGSSVPKAQLSGEQAVLSMILELPAPFNPSTACCGVVIDDWPEWIPSPEIDTGLSFQFDQPDTQPPQAMLLAAAPVETGNWTWNYLAGAVNEALTLSQIRLITLTDMRTNNSGLDQVLPAIRLPFLAANQQTPVVNPL